MIINLYKFTILFVILGTTSSFASDDLYMEMLNKHSQFGQLSDKELRQQKLEYQTNIQQRSSLNNQARKVASTIKSTKNIILKNPEVEISIK